MVHEDMNDTNDAHGETSQTIDIEVEDGINIDEEFGPFSSDDNDTGLQDEYVRLENSRNVQNDPDHQQSDDIIWNEFSRITSEYSQEESVIHGHQSSIVPHITPSENENDTTAGDIEIPQIPENHEHIDNGNFVDNYTSSRPETSSSCRNTTIPPYPSRCYDPRTGEIIIATVNQSVVSLLFHLDQIEVSKLNSHALPDRCRETTIK